MKLQLLLKLTITIITLTILSVTIGSTNLHQFIGIFNLFYR